ncbi:hypothetical protein TMatcc_000321 [Talaromyces marneffei ATCC 18224]|uniref:uncharacterized protein n=1 Tax=Talaromyces marneffei TaxID=37727 RepID=UPI0012A9C545|nr:uncharacterized protein EYB26_005400 [Talaromyces marneffei]KAE8549326.1 hypothetical protein EYB25_007847 [Talaromyces marneffei]QGA17724.1 hypothetical protein EYB26_005400 [Talaromyces marneffei]
MDSSELPHLPNSLGLGSQLPSGFNPQDVQSFQGFSSAIGDIDHNLQAASNFSQFNNANGRYDIAPPPRSAHDLAANNNQVSNRAQAWNSAGELEWVAASISSSLPNAQSRAQHDDSSLQVGGESLDVSAAAAAEIKDSHLGGLKIVPNPPDLDAWRERLFNVDEPITLTEEQFQIYFPHVDNVYSHRSTQKYKRKPFISHYWDCRLKGRPSGTPKSDDPNKKKRKRVARERDLCDVKIKITEYFPEATAADISQHQRSAANGLDSSALSSDNHHGTNATATSTMFFPSSSDTARGNSQSFGMLTPRPTLSENPSVSAGNGQTMYTIQRVNGNGGNGKTDGVSGGHRHTLEDSDRVKKNSVYRYLLKKSKDEKKVVVTQPKTYHKKATGEAQSTVKKRSQENDLKLFGSCFCPFVQRVWIALEAKGIPYQYIEVDPYDKPPELLAINPRGLIPALLHGNWGCYESTVLLEYLDDLDEGTPLLPPGDARLRAHCRLWGDHINRNIVPSFYKVLMEQTPQMQAKHAAELQEDIEKLVNASHVHGPFFLGPSMSYVDIQLAPWIIRLSRVLKPYRGWTEPTIGSRLGRWIQAIEGNEHVIATTSNDDLYLESYQRYSKNRPNTSQLANAINSDRGLP